MDVEAFRTVGKSGKAAVAAQGVEAVGAAGENFPGIALVADVPHDGIAGGIKAGEQGNGEFHHAQRGSQMTAVVRDHADDGVPQLLRQFLLLGKGKPGNVFGQMQAGEQRRVGHGNP